MSKNRSFKMNDRQKKILGILREKRFLTITEIANQIHFSKSTIRRDLDVLQNQNLIERTHGGALFMKPNEIEMPMNMKENINRQQKLYIAGLATNYVQENQTIFLDSSSSCSILGRELTNFTHLKIVTPNLITAEYLSQNSKNDVYVVGGKISDTFASSLVTAEQISMYICDIAFMSCRGLDINYGMTDRVESESMIKRAIIDHAKYNILLVDDSKFGKTLHFADYPIDKLDTIITNKQPTKKIQKYINDNNVELVY